MCQQLKTEQLTNSTLHHGHVTILQLHFCQFLAIHFFHDITNFDIPKTLYPWQKNTHVSYLKKC